MADGEILNREFIAERDLRIFNMKKAGVSVSEIARRFNLSVPATNASINRQLAKLNREAQIAYPEMLRLELERLDTLQQAIWPMTQHRRVTLDDGTTIDVEPDLKAIQQVLQIMEKRTKLMGMDATQINFTVDTNMPTPVLADYAEAGPVEVHNPEAEARQLLELMGGAGILDEGTVNAILSQNNEIESTEEEEIVDAEIIE